MSRVSRWLATIGSVVGLLSIAVLVLAGWYAASLPFAVTALCFWLAWLLWTPLGGNDHRA